MKTFDNFSGRLIDHDELHLRFKELESGLVMDNAPDKPCIRCNCYMVLIAEHAFMELWECPQCGYLERVKQ